MEWLKKKKQEAKQAAAKLQNKRTAFAGEGNVLGGEGSAAHGGAPPTTASANGKSSSFKIPFAKNEPPPLSEEEKERRREMQAKALEARTNAWDKRVNTARKARLAKEDELDNKFDHLPPPPSSASSTTTGDHTGVPSSAVLSNEEVKRRELENATAQLGFNPYAATFASSTEVGAATNSIGGAAPTPQPLQPLAPPPAPVAVMPPRPPMPSDNSFRYGKGAIEVLVRQDPPRAIAAAETIIKMLKNILKNPEEEKFRRVRLSNANIQTKLVSVPGALDLLRETGFIDLPIDDEAYLALDSDSFDPDFLTSTIDRIEFALMDLKVVGGGLV